MRWLVFLLPFSALQALDFELAVQEMIYTGTSLNRYDLCPGFCGCFSRRLSENRIAITESWKHKTELQFSDFLIIDLHETVHGFSKTCPGDAPIHTCLFRFSDRIGAVLHTHSVSTLALSRLLLGQSSLIIDGVQIPSLFHRSHHCQIEIPIFENCQSFSTLAADLESVLKKKKNVFGFLIRGDGFYTWGWDMQEARSRAEFFEKLFQTEILLRCSCP